MRQDDPINDDTQRIPPQAIDAEQAVLGGLLLEPGALDRVLDTLEPGDFYRHDHRRIFEAICDLSGRGRPIDLVTLGEWFQANAARAPDANGAYLEELSRTTPSAANIAAYALIVREKSLLRRLIEAGTQIINDGHQPGTRDLREVLDLAEQRVFTLAERSQEHQADFVPLREAMREAFTVLQERYEAQGDVTGLPTGFVDLDHFTAGLQPTDLIILAARPSQGKTSLALNIAEHAAVHANTPVAVFSMEMSASQLGARLIASLGRVDAQKLRTGQLEDEDWRKVNHAIQRLSKAKMYIDDTPALTPLDLRGRARRLKREHHIGLVVVDYLQLMHVEDGPDNRATEIAEISRSLKGLAKELNVPVLALSQLNRALESRGDKRPVMSDLRESGGIEQDADVILFIYRDEVYNKDNPDNKGLAEVIIGKQRNGPTGVVTLHFNGSHTRFDSLSRESTNP